MDRPIFVGGFYLAIFRERNMSFLANVLFVCLNPNKLK